MLRASGSRIISETLRSLKELRSSPSPSSSHSIPTSLRELLARLAIGDSVEISTAMRSAFGTSAEIRRRLGLNIGRFLVRLRRVCQMVHYHRHHRLADRLGDAPTRARSSATEQPHPRRHGISRHRRLPLLGAIFLNDRHANETPHHHDRQGRDLCNDLRAQ